MRIKYSFESGRSMLELLGTLAIIGILSAGSIVGYSYAMNKHRANKTIDDINRRAMDIISHLSQGTTPNLDAWQNETTIYPISLSSEEDETNYYLKVEKIPFEVCNIITESMSQIIEIEIEVDNDTHACAAGQNILYFTYEGFERQGSNNGISCPLNTSIEGLGGYTGVSGTDGSRCYCKDADMKWDSTTSTCVIQDGTCSSHADCNKGEFCQFSPTDGGCTPPTSGVCKNLSNCGESGTYEQFWMSNYSNDCHPDWWTAQDICSAKGMTMVSLSDIQCTSNPATCAPDTISNLRNNGLNNGFWTTDTPSNSCYAWGMSGASANILATGPRVNPYNVLCKK